MKFVKMGRRKTAENSQSSSSSSYCMKLRSSSSSRVVEKQQNIPAPVLNNSNDHHKKKRENQHAGQSTTPKRICTRQSREKPHAQLDNVPEIDPVEPVIQVEENERIARMLQENKNKGKEQSRENPSGRHVKHPETALVEIVRQFEEDEAMARRLQAQLEVEGNVNSSILRREDSRSFSSQDDEEEDVSDGEEDVSEVEEDVSDGDGDEDEYDDHFEEEEDDDCLLRMEDFFSSHDDEEEDVSDGYDDEDEYDAQVEEEDDVYSSLLRMEDSRSISSLDDEEENVSFGYDDEDEYDDEEVSEGLPETELNRFPVTKYVQRPISASCAVCLSDYKDGDDLRTLPCTHTFHKCCVDKWLMRKASCPVCRLTVRITV